MEELTQAGRGLRRRYGLAVRGGVAGVFDEARLDRERLPDQRPEARLGEMGGKRRLERVLQRPVTAVQPKNGRLQRQPAIESGGTRIGKGKSLRLGNVRKNVGKFGFEESELRHRRRKAYSAASISSMSLRSIVLTKSFTDMPRAWARRERKASTSGSRWIGGARTAS
jgi:hypothetical protein